MNLHLNWVVSTRASGSQMEQAEIVEKIPSVPALPEPFIADHQNGAQQLEWDIYRTHEKPDSWDHVLCAVVLACLAVLIYGAIEGNWFQPMMLDMETSRWARL